MALEQPVEAPSKSRHIHPIFEFNGSRYRKCGRYYQNDVGRLHRHVWEAFNGPIPQGFHIHHKDGDPANNHINNLELLSASEHLSGHMVDVDRKQTSTASLLRNGVPAAALWRKRNPELATQIGRKAASAMHEAANRTWKEYTCAQCGNLFQAREHYRKGKRTSSQHGPFCSYNCAMAHRRKRGSDDIKKVCPQCGREYSTNRYKASRTCSRSCGQKWSGRNRLQHYR